MYRYKHYFMAASAFLFLIISSPIKAQEKSGYKSIMEAVLSSSKLRGNAGPKSVNWIDGGNRYSYTTHNDSTKRDEIRSFDPATLGDKLIFDASNLKFPGSSSSFKYRSFQWAHDSKHLVFLTNFRKIYRRSGKSDYYIYSLKDKTLKLGAKDARTAELSPDGSMMGYEREGNMYLYNFGTKKETQLTNDATKEIFNGHYDWVYEEEFGQAQAWNWSPDGRFIAYWQFDESKVPIIQMTNYEGLHPKYEKIPIPQVGDPNPSVRIGVIDVKTGKKMWLDSGNKGDFYIPRIYWTSEPNTLAMMVLNRAQNDMKLYFFNVVTGEHKLIMEEKNDTWVAIFNFYTGVKNMIYFPEKLNEFFWVSDRSGYYHIYRYGYDGKLINQVTSGNWDIIKVLGISVNDKTIYYVSAEASPLEQQLYSIKFDGSDKQKISAVPGYHRINMSPNTKYYIDSYSNINQPLKVDLKNSKGDLLKNLEDNASVGKFLASHKYSPKELFSFTTSDSVKLDCSMIKPFDFDSTKKYPAILAIYGGPESHSVFNSFETNGWHQYLAQQGYIVVDVNNRGNANYGSKFMKVVYKQLGKWESHDFVETAHYLAKLPYVDGSEIAIMGTSYGGYSTTYTMVTHPGVFKVGIANSAVTDWRLYDDIYTERYMGLLQDNEKGYVKSAVMTYADSLKGKLLLIHSTMDDNVHVRNTMQLLTALTNAGKDVDLRIYPPGAHGAAYNLSSYVLIMKVYDHYLNRYLKGECDQQIIN